MIRTFLHPLYDKVHGEGHESHDDAQESEEDPIFPHLIHNPVPASHYDD